MKKTFLRPHIKFLLIIVIAALMLNGCEKDDGHSHNHKKASLNVKRQSFDDLMQTENFRNAFEKIPKSKHTSMTHARTVMEDQYGFTISDVPAKVIESDSAISYTLLILRDTTTTSNLENLVINYNKFSNVTDALILNYDL